MPIQKPVAAALFFPSPLSLLVLSLADHPRNNAAADGKMAQKKRSEELGQT